MPPKRRTHRRRSKCRSGGPIELGTSGSGQRAMNLDDKPGNGIEPGDPASNAASLAQVTLKSPKPGQAGPKQKRPRNASDAMGGAAAKDKPGKAKSRKKALSF